MLITTMLFMSIASYATDVTETAKKIDTTLSNISAGASLVNQTLDMAHVDFKGATEFKDTVAAIFLTLSTDSDMTKMKLQTLELIQLGQEAKKANDSILSKKLVLSILGLILMAAGWFSRHFGVFVKKK